MKQYLVFMAFILVANTSYSQLVSGYVVDGESRERIPQASIYFQSTSNGTVSDSLGNFHIRTSISNPVPLIISAVGYYPEIVTNPPIGKMLEVNLKKKVTELREVVLAFDGISREEKEGRFLNEFLGMPINLHGCTIQNIDDVSLYYSKKSATLTASSDKAIEIHNPFLGYSIQYTLVKFENSRQGTGILGFFYFNELENPGIDRKKVLKNRENAYLGSRMHFIRSLWSGNLNDNKFKIFDKTKRRLNIAEVLLVKGDKKYMLVQDALYVEYKGDATLIQAKQPGILVEIDAKGYFSSTDIVWSGEMAIQRMAALLPFDYEP